MIPYILTAAANLLVGGCVGLCGVAGFLLPMFYTGVLSMGVSESLALSFAAFIVSGILGSIGYGRSGSLDLGFGIRLSIGSFIGALLGVRLNLIIPEELVKKLLYVVVLLSGISILLRKDAGDSRTGASGTSRMGLPLVLGLGFVTGLICALSGAGGPVLVMPLLVVLGMDVRTAVGVALFNSIFIGIPAAAGYMLQCDMGELLPYMVIALLTHGAGVFQGSRMSERLDPAMLKEGIAIFSIVLALLRLGGIV